MEVYSPQNDSWRVVADNLPTFELCSAAVHNGRIVLCGKNAGEASRCLTFAPSNSTWQQVTAPFNDAVSDQRANIFINAKKFHKFSNFVFIL